MDSRITRFFFSISGPLRLLGGVVLYALGVGIARYLGNPVDWSRVLLGQTWVITFQLGSHYLSAYFLLPANPRDPSRIAITDNGDEPHVGIRRDLVLLSAFTAFTATASLTLILMRFSNLTHGILILMGLMFAGAILYAVPPFRLGNSGYGELILSITMADFFPALGYMFQNDELHRLVAMTTFPLTMLYLALLLAVQLSHYPQDLRLGRGTLLVRLGWERGVVFHNILLLGSFLLIGIAMLFGLPVGVAMPVFFVLPLSLFQIWLMTRIASGAKPNWRVLNFTAIFSFGLTAYLFTFAYWVR